MSYSKGSYGAKGFIVNTSAIAAQSLDVSAGGRSSSDVLLSVAVKDTYRQSYNTKELEAKKTSDELLLQSLQDGSYFGVSSTSSYSGGNSYGSSYSGGSYSGGGYGQFINDPGTEDLARYGLDPQPQPATAASPEIGRGQEYPTGALKSPATSNVTNALDRIKSFLTEHKLFVLLAILAALLVVFRKK